MASKKTAAGMKLILAKLKKNPKVSYADVKAAAEKKKLTVYPIIYGRAKLLLGHVKAGSGKTKTTNKTAKRGPGRPKGSKNKRGFRYKTILGDRLRSRGADAQAVDARLACNILNQMTDLGRPESYAIGS